MFYPDRTPGPAQFVSPNTLVAANNHASAPVQRIYPGMHSQAAQVKAQQAQKQEQMPRQQPRPQGQKSLPALSPTKNQPAKDPLVEESISRVLNRMRQASVASTVDDDGNSMTGISSMRRIKKDEDDMDEDERLLASEDGKKLSSKERRQLRNKVSARAFRSRKKEYITQLEGEAAVKVQEANELRTQNQQLREENTRLTDLTRMLLSSQAFSGFLQELSQSGLPAPNLQSNPPQPKPVQSQPRPATKDVASQGAAHQMHVQQPRIGMALIPETSFDYSTFQPPNAWMSALPTNDFQVFSVMEMPEAPVLDLEVLSGKSKSSSSYSKPSKDIPQLPDFLGPAPPATEVSRATQIDDSVYLDPKALALYFDSSASDLDQPSVSLDALSSKDEGVSEEDKLAQLKKMCSDLDEACSRLAELTPHRR